MNQVKLKPFRVIVGIIVFLLSSLLFIDIREKIPLQFHDYVLFPQFVPSLLNFINTISWIATGFIIITILSFVFGRVYCSFLCPLGILQDMISFISKKLKIFKRYRHSKAQQILRYSLLGVTVIFLLFNIVFFVALLDPYSNFGRIMNGLVRPVVIAGNNLLASLFTKMEIYYFAPAEVKTNFLAVAFPLTLTGLLIWMAGKRGRLFCNTICPVGTLLGLMSNVSLFRIKINKDSCISCGKCAFACKAECINIKTQTVDMSRCVGCMNCITSCETRDIGYQLAVKPVIANTNHDKRDFVSGSISAFLLFFGFSGFLRSQENNSGHHHKKHKPTTISNKKNYFASPPGSESHEHYNNTCTACHLCVAVCPTKVLQPSTLQYGLKGFMQPYMDYTTSYCNFDCTRCSEVCPTGAILPVSIEEKKVKQLGKVIFLKKNCVVYTEETACGSCAEHCPTKAVHMVPYKGNLTIPETDQNICIGCGACEYACPMKPFKAIFVDGLAVHQQAEKPKIEKLEEEVMEDFPF